MTALSNSVQDYLKAIYKLANAPKAGEMVTTSLIAERMTVSPASATNMIKRLAELRLLDHKPYQGVELTPTGEKMALEIVRHHRLLELYLREALGGQTAIGEHVRDVQKTFAGLYNAGPELATDGSQFDRLLADGEVLTIGDLELEVMSTPGHTPACASYRVGDALFVGDTIYAESEILSKRASESRPNQGIVSARTTGKKSDGTVFMTYERSFLVPKRGHGVDDVADY